MRKHEVIHICLVEVFLAPNRKMYCGNARYVDPIGIGIGSPESTIVEVNGTHLGASDNDWYVK